MATLPADVFVRAADALHLACAGEAGLHEVYSSDRHLVAAAPHFGLRPVTLGPNTKQSCPSGGTARIPRSLCAMPPGP